MTGIRSIGTLALLTMLAAGCGERPTDVAADVPAQLAKGSNPGGGGGSDTEADPTATFVLAAEGFGLTGDGAYSNEYAEGICGVHSKIFATTEASNSGDAIMHTSNPKYKDRRCSEYPRKVSIDYGTGTPALEEVFINLRGIHNTEYSIPVGQTAEHPLHVNPESSTVCEGALIFNTEYQGAGIEARPVYVTRTAADRWLVQTDDPRTSEHVEDASAYCSSTGAYHTISVRFEIVSSRDL